MGRRRKEKRGITGELGLTRVDKELTVLLKRAEWKDCEK
jgi:hypothetical protein